MDANSICETFRCNMCQCDLGGGNSYLTDCDHLLWFVGLACFFSFLIIAGGKGRGAHGAKHRGQRADRVES